MAVKFGNQILFIDNDNGLLSTLQGDILCYTLYYLITNNEQLTIQDIVDLIQSPEISPIVRLSVLNPDETLDYMISPEDIVEDSVVYNEKYTNAQRRDLSFKLINIPQRVYNIKTRQYEKQYKYFPQVDGLWYGTKIKYEQGIRYRGNEYYFPKGIYIIDNFDLVHNVNAKDVTYQCTDKFGMFDGPTGILEDGYEIPVDTPIEEAIDDLMNLSCTDGYINDFKVCIIDSKYIGFKTQSTIRIDAGGNIGDLIEQLATQMSAEYYYNTVGNLVLYPVDSSMNDINKPIVWTYNESQIEGLKFTGNNDIVNVVKVVGNNVDGKIYSAVSKNTNLNSPINIYRIKERRMSPIDTANIWSDDMAQELADYNLRQKSILSLQQSCSVLYNPILMVNNIVEIENEELDMKRNRYLINGISYTSGSITMQIDISNITNLPIVGGINYAG